jgi:transcriptional regulator with XRE-family HTH domain
MAIHADASDLSGAATEFHEILGALGFAQRRVAQLFGVGSRSVRRWQRGDRRIPLGVNILMHLLTAKTVTIEQVEQVAVALSARTNGGGSPAPLRGDANPTPTIGEKILALEGCRWPFGDPRHANFRFCGSPVVGKSYCECHRRMAYMAPSAQRLSHNRAVLTSMVCAARSYPAAHSRS